MIPPLASFLPQPADFRFGFRLLARRPGQTAVAVLALGLGIGLTTAMYSILYGTFLRGLPFEDGDRFVIVDRSNPAAGLPRVPVPYRDFLEWRRQQRSFEDLAAWLGDSVGLAAEGVAPQRVNGAFVTVNFLDVVGIAPLLGRGFLEEDAAPAAPPVVLISHRMWQEMFRGDPAVVGRPVEISGEPTMLVGVMPPGFGFPLRQDAWKPLRIDPGSELAAAPMLQVFGKRRPGVSLRQAQAEMSALAGRLARERPDTNAGFGALLSPYTWGYTDEGVRKSQALILLAAAAVLLIACANVAGLLQLQTVQRLHELGVRSALGAGRRRLAGQLLVEAGLLGLAGALLGLLVADWSVEGYRRLFGDLALSWWMEIRLHPAALPFALGAMLAAVLLSGLPAAFFAARIRPAEILKQASGSGSWRGRVHKWLAVSQVAVSFSLLAATGLMVKSLSQLARVELGAAPDRILVGQLSLDSPAYQQVSEQVRFLQEIERRTGVLPGVRAAGVGTSAPGRAAATVPFGIEGRAYPSEEVLPVTRQAAVSPSYFDVLGLPLLEGRPFQASDGPGSPPVAIVNRSFARRHFPDGSPVGRRIRLRNDPGGPWVTIVGLVPDVAMGGIEGREHDGLYQPVSQSGGRWISLFVRTERDPLALAPDVRGAAAALDPSMVVFWISSLQGVVDIQTLTYRAAAALFSFFGLLALFLASLGLYGVLSFAVRENARDLGVRMALGASGSQIRGLVLREGAVQIAAGLLLGAGLSAAGLRLLAGLVFDVSLWDPAVLAAAAAAVAGVGLLACLIPADRASRVPPLRVIR